VDTDYSFDLESSSQPLYNAHNCVLEINQVWFVHDLFSKIIILKLFKKESYRLENVNQNFKIVFNFLSY